MNIPDYKPGDEVKINTGIETYNNEGKEGVIIDRFEPNECFGVNIAWNVRHKDGGKSCQYAKYLIPTKVNSWRGKLE